MTTMSASRNRHVSPALEEHPADPRVERILLVTDGGDAGCGATAWVEHRAKMHRLDVSVVTVLEQDRMTAELTGEGINEEAERVLERVARHIATAAPSVRLTTTVAWGDAPEIIGTASQSADLVVVGTSRVRGTAFVGGSAFPTRLVEGANRPVIIVPTNWRPGHGAVVVGLQGDMSDTTALAFAAHEASVLRRELRVVHAGRASMIFDSDVAPAGDEDEASSTVGTALRHAVTELREIYPRLSVRGVVRLGQPEEVLTEESEGEELLVVGSHGWTAFDRFFVGSVSREILTRVICPLAVVRSQGQHA
jgi:nucleotide-binding universal stress UspA family protein